jgi:TetR/AcrR family transcriptional regulator, cholesterol catabolism regulator
MSMPDNNPDKRRKIINTTISLFQQTHDVKKVSLDDIARIARVSPTTIYNNFGNREALVYEVVKALIRENIDKNAALVHSDKPFPQKLAGIINGKMDMVSKLNQEIIDKIVSQDKAIAPFIDKIYENEIKPLWKEILTEGKKQGYIDPSLHDEALLIYLDVMKTGFASRQDLMQDVATKTDLYLTLARIMFYGFLKKDIDLFPK